MVTKILTVTACDRCGGEEDVEKHKLGLDRLQTENDLCAACLAEIKAVLDPVMESGRRIVIPRKKRTPRTVAAEAAPEPQAVEPEAPAEPEADESVVSVLVQPKPRTRKKAASSSPRKPRQRKAAANE